MSDLRPADLNCTHGVPWIWHTMRICVLSQKDELAVACGIINIITVLIFGIPQIIKNFKYGIPEGSISPHLLAFWTIGDLLNFIGAVLVRELLLQIIVVIYGIIMDFILVFQYLYYTRQNKKNLLMNYQDNYSLDNESVPVSSLNLRGGVVACLTITSFATVSSTPVIDFLPNIYSYVGYAFGWISAVLYLLSRLPQIRINYKRKATDGLSIGVFICTILGNISYGSQIFLTSTDPSFLLKSLPWIVGSLGCLFLDFIIFSQFFLYKKKPDIPQIPPTESVRTICLSSSENTSQESLVEKDSKPLIDTIRV